MEQSLESVNQMEVYQGDKGYENSKTKNKGLLHAVTGQLGESKSKDR